MLVSSLASKSDPDATAGVLQGFRAGATQIGPCTGQREEQHG